MAIFFDAPVTPDAQTAFVREVPQRNGLLLSSIFPSRTVDSNEVEIGYLTRTNGTARYRSYDGRIHVSNRDAVTAAKIKLPALSDSTNMGEYERLLIEFARVGGTRSEALASAIYDDSERLTRNVQNRMEMAIGDLLADGVITINENGFAATVDYGVPAGNKPVAATPWTDPAADVIGELTAWSDAYTVLNGTPPASILTSRRIARAIQSNQAIIGAVSGTNTGRTRVNSTELQQLLDSEGLPSQITTYDAVFDVDGTSTRALPDDKVVLLPDNPEDLLSPVWGVSATALELVDSNQSDLSFEEAAGIVGVVIKEGPPFRQFTFVDAVGIPVLADANRLFVGDVA